jgi:hypothetical protein
MTTRTYALPPFSSGQAYTQTPLQYAGAPPAATRSAIVKYLRYIDDPLFEPEPDMLEMRLICEHCSDAINSPWLLFPPELLAELRRSIEHVKLPEELASWLLGAAQIGVEPL